MRDACANDRAMPDWHEVAARRRWRARRARGAGHASPHATGSTPREAGTAMVVTRTMRCRHDRRRPSRVRGAAARARRAARTRHRPRTGSCAFRSRRGSANAAAASRRCRSRRSIAGALCLARRRGGMRARQHAVRGRRIASSPVRTQAHGSSSRPTMRAARSATQRSIRRPSPRRARALRCRRPTVAAIPASSSAGGRHAVRPRRPARRVPDLRLRQRPRRSRARAGARRAARRRALDRRRASTTFPRTCPPNVEIVVDRRARPPKLARRAARRATSSS